MCIDFVYLITYYVPEDTWSLRFTHGRGTSGGSVGWASDFSSGRDLMVRELEPCSGLCADNSEPGAYFTFCVSLSDPPPLALYFSLSLSLSLSKINKH